MSGDAEQVDIEDYGNTYGRGESLFPDLQERATVRGVTWAGRVESEKGVVIMECLHEHLLQSDALACAEAMLEEGDWRGNVEYF